MNDDGFDGIVVGKLFELGNDLLGREDYAVEFDDANLGAEAGKGIFIGSAKAHIYQRKDRSDKQRK